MSDSLLEHVSPGGGGGGGGDVNVISWGGVAVSPATAKSDSMSAALVVPEVGAIAQFFNGATYDLGRSGFVGPLTAPFAGIQTVIPVGVYNVAAPVLADGQAVSLQFDVSGQLKTSGGGGGASIGLVGAAVPLSANYTGFIDAAGLLQGARTYDTDSGGGVENTLGVVLRISGAGASVEVGTVASPLNVRTSTESALGPLATEATLATRASEATLATRAAAAQLPVALVGGRLDVNVGASVLPTGAATEATLATRASEATLATRASEATLATRLAEATFTARINTLGQKTMAGSTPVVLPSDQAAIPVTNTPVQPGNASVTSVAANAGSVTILAGNANRKGAMITNDSVTGTLYLKLGAVASTTSYTAKLIPGAYYELPSPVYFGIIDGIWDIASGNARVTETTP
jgi:hypothetical protein